MLLLNEPLAACWVASQSAALVIAAETAGLDFWSWSISTARPVVSTLPVGLAAASQLCVTESLAENEPRKKPAAHCCWSRKLSAELALLEPALLRALAA